MTSLESLRQQHSSLDASVPSRVRNKAARDKRFASVSGSKHEHYSYSPFVRWRCFTCATGKEKRQRRHWDLRSFPFLPGSVVRHASCFLDRQREQCSVWPLQCSGSQEDHTRTRKEIRADSLDGIAFPLFIYTPRFDLKRRSKESVQQKFGHREATSVPERETTRPDGNLSPRDTLQRCFPAFVLCCLSSSLK